MLFVENNLLFFSLRRFYYALTVYWYMTVQYFNQRGFTILNNNANDMNEKEQHLTDKYVTNIKKNKK